MATQMKLPDHLAELASNFKESSCGACRVTLVLDNQKTVKNVTLAWGEEIIKIGGHPIDGISDVGFTSSQIIEVLPE